MRVRCPACGAPYFVREELPPEEAKCPNCEAPAPKPGESPRPERRAPPEPEGRSRAVTLVAVLNLLMAASGLCVTVGLASVTGEQGPNFASVHEVAIYGTVMVAWLVAGVGILVHWAGRGTSR